MFENVLICQCVLGEGRGQRSRESDNPHVYGVTHDAIVEMLVSVGNYANTSHQTY
jgi:hypothetical protein